jgi:hypothetical protein
VILTFAIYGIKVTFLPGEPLETIKDDPASIFISLSFIFLESRPASPSDPLSRDYLMCILRSLYALFLLVAFKV